jgi:hypothetical protein
METSKLISIFIAKLKIAYPNYFKELSSEQMLEMISLYQDMLGEYNEETLNIAAKEIIKAKKFYPSLSEIIEICERSKTYKRDRIIELMKEDGYFKDSTELEKVYMWLEEGIIPSWLKEDMKKYAKLEIQNKERILLEG